MIIGVGIDVVEISRIDSASQRWGERFLNRVFTAGEREYSGARVNGGQHYAARFAAKEALYKALGGGVGIGWKDIEVVSSGAKPTLTLTGRAKQVADARCIEHFHLSLSHSGDIAVAVVVAEA